MIATGINSCGYVFDSSSGSVSQRAESLLPKLEEFAENDESLSERDDDSGNGVGSSLLSGSLSMALCCILCQLFNEPVNILVVCVILDVYC